MINKPKEIMPCIILCGGQSSRMKEDKSLLAFSSYSSLAQFQYERLKLEFKKVYISAKENKFDFKLDIILDKSTIFSPIIALQSILKNFEKSHIKSVFILSVDTPFVSISSIKKLILSSKKYDTCIAQTSRKHNLSGVFNINILDKIDLMLKQNIHKVSYLLDICDTKYITFSNENEFINLNKKEDYEKALSLL